MQNKKLWFLTKESLKRKVKSKWFFVVNVLLVLLIIGLINLDSIINMFGGDFNEVSEILVIDNTNKSYDILDKSLYDAKGMFESNIKFKLKKYDKSEKDAKKEIIEYDKILVVLNNNEENYMDSKIVSNSYIDTILYQLLVSSINSTKEVVALSLSNIDQQELSKINAPIKIDREYLDKDKNNSEENMNMIMSSVFPILILPFFMLSIFLIQMIGSEVNDEKATRGMEIIISNVSPKTHFFSKILAGNLFVFIQAGILLISGIAGLYIRSIITPKNTTLNGIINLDGIFNALTSSGIMDKLWIVIILTIILLVLSFLAYSLIAGILASMTANVEDYQQIQTPIIIVSLVSYYLAIMASMFNGSIFIRIMSYIPFISAMLSPALLVMGQISIVDVLISIGIMVVTVFLFIKYGLKIYKVGILNYSSSKLWTKMFKAVKQK